VKLLILGGTIFLGRHCAEEALGRGHQVTLFNRGQHHPELFPEAEQLRGDRDGGLRPLEDRRFDAVIDTSGYVPRVVGDSARRLAASTDRYAFVSTCSVYAAGDADRLVESSPLATLEDAMTEEVTGETYGGLKVLCERAVEQAFGERALIVRPGLIVGPHDPTDRFTYWPCRLARGGTALAPDVRDSPVQFLDVRSLAAWILDMLESGRHGVFNAVGPKQPSTFGELIEACLAAAERPAEIRWIDPQLLRAHEVAPWSDLPLWVPADARAIFRVDASAAFAAGLEPRPVAETIGDTLGWASSRPADHEWKAGLSPEREQALLEALA